MKVYEMCKAVEEDALCLSRNLTGWVRYRQVLCHCAGTALCECLPGSAEGQDAPVLVQVLVRPGPPLLPYSAACPAR